MVIAILLVVGCASMVSTKEELQNLSENEGVVIGSVLLTVEEGKEGESGWAFLKGKKAGDLDWTISIRAVSLREPGIILLATKYSIPAKPGVEEYFIKKLPAGSYSMRRMQPVGLFAPDIYLSLPVSFTVKPRQTSYIGKLAVGLPNRIAVGSLVRVAVLDAQDETIEKLRGEHSHVVLENTAKDLATASP
jgi:hypothetical protein